MDTALREYQRKMASGEGSMEQYLRLLARSGYTINHALNDHHRSMVENHLLNKSSADFSPMGYDKMTPTIETIRFMMDTGLVGICLIVCPAARIPVWSERFRSMTPGLDVVPVSGRSREKRRLLAKPGKVFIISYSFLIKIHNKWPRPQKDPLTPSLLIADEASFIKNPRANRSKCCYALADKVGYRIALSSTPVNHLEDFWGICRFIDYRIFGKKFYKFKQKYFDLYMEPYPDWRPKKGAKEMILARFKEVCK